MTTQPQTYYTLTSSILGRCLVLFSDNPRESRAMTETELKAREQFARLFSNFELDNDDHDVLFRFVMKNLEHCDKLQPLTNKDLTC
jgi:hypothetical protein